MNADMILVVENTAIGAVLVFWIVQRLVAMAKKLRKYECKLQ